MSNSNPDLRASSKFLRFVLTIAVATLFGPLIAGVTVFVAMAAMMTAHMEIKTVLIADFLTGLGGEFVVMTGAAYLGGAVIAFAAGAFVAIHALWRKPTPSVVLFAVIVANLGYYAAVEPAVFVTTDSTLPLRKLIISILFSLYAGAVCWLLFRRLLRGPTPP